MKTSKLTAQEKNAIAIAAAASVVIGVLFLRQYFSIFIVSIIIAFLFHPIYRKLQGRFSDNTAAGLTMLSSLLLIVIPLIFTLLLSFNQLRTLSSSLGNNLTYVDLSSLGAQVIQFLNDILKSIPFTNFELTESSLIETLKNIATAISNNMLNFISSAATGFFGFFTSFIIYIYVQFSMLKNGPRLINSFKLLNPLGNQVSDLYIKKASAMIKGTVQGQFIIAIVQGFLAAATFALVGYSQFFFILFVIFSMLSVIPLGAGILAMPLGVLIALFGNVTGGIIINLQHVLINTNVDNVLRPILVPKEARLDSALMLVSVFAGLGLFGFLGLFIGPTLMIIIVTTLQVYIEVFKKNSRNHIKSQT
jgi:predicted PurR-regulated permease PerM